MASLWDWLSSRLGTSRGASAAVAAGESFELLSSPWAAAYPTAMAAATKTAATEPNRRTDLLICAPIVVTRCGGRRRRERIEGSPGLLVEFHELAPPLLLLRSRCRRHGELPPERSVSDPLSSPP